MKKQIIAAAVALAFAGSAVAADLSDQFARSNKTQRSDTEQKSQSNTQSNNAGMQRTVTPTEIVNAIRAAHTEMDIRIMGRTLAVDSRFEPLYQAGLIEYRTWAPEYRDLLATLAAAWKLKAAGDVPAGQMFDSVMSKTLGVN